MEPAELDQLSNEAPTRGSQLFWPFEIRSNGIRTLVVEPSIYAPALHGNLFTELIVAAFAPVGRGGNPSPGRAGLPGFDLMSFPEAFIDADTLVQTLEFVKGQTAASIFHVGLRSGLGRHHLFTVDETVALVKALRALQPDRLGDLDAFEAWLSGVENDGHFNLACMFAIDADKQLRICLHPKNTPSPFEQAVLPEQTMTSAQFAAVVILVPRDKHYRKVYIQPVICSDLVSLRTSLSGPGPIAVITLEAERLGEDPPDQIDIVSAVTCTPQVDVNNNKNLPVDLQWQPKFRATFEAAIKDPMYARHSKAMFVLSNVRRTPPSKDAAGDEVPGDDYGLSGIFVPVKPAPTPSAPGSKTWMWGRSGDRDREWKLANDGQVGFKASAQLLTIHPDVADETAAARIMRTTVPVLPRFQQDDAAQGPIEVSVMVWLVNPGRAVAVEALDD